MLRYNKLTNSVSKQKEQIMDELLKLKIELKNRRDELKNETKELNRKIEVAKLASRYLNKQIDKAELRDELFKIITR